MRVLFYNHTGRASGAERVLILAVKHLDRSAFQPAMVCPPGELSHEVENLGIPVSHLDELNARLSLSPHKLIVYTFSLFRAVLALRREIARLAAEVVHANSPRSGVAALMATAGTAIPVVWHVHDEFTGHPISRLIRFVAGSSKRCSIIAVSEATARSFKGDSKRLADRIRVIHNAVDITEIDSRGSSISIREQLGLTNTDFLFGIVGQITPRKGQKELIKAFAKAANEMPFAKLLIVGAPLFDHDTAYHDEVTQLTTTLGLADRVLFLGQRSDAIEIIKQLDTLVINSKSEAFVMVAIEAMACRTPVIATDVGGTNEMIENGTNGILVAPEDEEAMIGALIEMYGSKDLRDLFAARSREKADKDLNIGRFAFAFQNALRKAAVPAVQATSQNRSADVIENP